MSILVNSNITTPTKEAVLEQIKEWEGKGIDLFSKSKDAQKLLDKYTKAIDSIYSGLKAQSKDTIIFTSSASEATSQIFYSFYLQYIITGRKNAIIIFERAPIEEIKLSRILESQGCRIHRIPATVDGTFDLEIFKEYINSKTAFVSVPMVDDESGVIQPIEEIGNICQLYGVDFYCNASWAAGRVGIDLSRLPLSYMSIDAELIEGPKDTALLYINKDATKLMPLIHGFDSEQGSLRKMIDPLKVIAFAKALEMAVDFIEFDIEDIRELRDELEQGLLDIEGSFSLAPWALRVPTVAIMAFEGVHGGMLLDFLAKKEIIAYSYATLSRGHFERKSLIEIASLKEDLKYTTIGFSLNSFNTQEEIKQIITTTKELVEDIRNNISKGVCKE